MGGYWRTDSFQETGCGVFHHFVVWRPNCLNVHGISLLGKHFFTIVFQNDVIWHVHSFHGITLLHLLVRKILKRYLDLYQ